MSSDEDYLFDETDDRDSGNDSPDNSDEEEEVDWGMDIGLGKAMQKKCGNIQGRLKRTCNLQQPFSKGDRLSNLNILPINWDIDELFRSDENFGHM